MFFPRSPPFRNTSTKTKLILSHSFAQFYHIINLIMPCYVYIINSCHTLVHRRETSQFLNDEWPIVKIRFPSYFRLLHRGFTICEIVYIEDLPLNLLIQLARFSSSCFKNLLVFSSINLPFASNLFCANVAITSGPLTGCMFKNINI
jgi:hypothetical protein